MKQVKDKMFMFGVSSDKSEEAKALLYPRPSGEDDINNAQVKPFVPMSVYGRR